MGLGIDPDMALLRSAYSVQRLKRLGDVVVGKRYHFLCRAPLLQGFVHLVCLLELLLSLVIPLSEFMIFPLRFLLTGSKSCIEFRQHCRGYEQVFTPAIFSCKAWIRLLA